MPARPGYYPETVVFVLDVCEDPGIEYNKHSARLELLKQCIGYCAQAKSRVNPSHKFGLAVIRDSGVQWEGAGVTASAEGLLAALRAVQPQPPPPPALPAAASGLPAGSAPTASSAGASAPRPLDLGEVVSLVQPLAVAEEADGCRVRVVLVYCRSTVVPVWTSRHRPGEALSMDVLFVHDKAAAAAVAAAWPDCATPQDIYTWLEDHVDELSGRAGHHAYIFEAGGHLVRKVTNLLVSLVAHPAQRPPQRELRPNPLDLAAMPPQPTSATAAATNTTTTTTGLDNSAFPPLSTATGVPAAAAAQLPPALPAGAGAWGLPATAVHSYSPPGLAAVAVPAAASPPAPPAPDLIDLTSPTETHPLPPPPPPAASLPVVPAYRPPGLGPVAGTTSGTSAASAALAGMSIAPLPPPPPAAPHGAEGAVAVAAAADPWAAEPPAWADALPPPPPAAAGPGRF